MSMDFVFAYGASMNRSDLRCWLEADGYDSSLIVDATPAKLHGYDYVWNHHSGQRGGGKANLEPKEGSTVFGLLIEFEDQLLKAFDRKEGHPTFYSRRENRVPVQRLSDGKTVLAWLYLAGPNRGDRRDVWPTRQYKKLVLDAAQFWNFPQECIEKIRNWQAV